MQVEVLKESIERRLITISLDEGSRNSDVYGFTGNSGKVFLEGQLLAKPGKLSETVLIFMHPSSSLGLLPMPVALAEAGYDVMCCGSRYLRNDTPLIMEKVAMDLGAYIQYARKTLGYRHVVLAGWSGGGSLSIFYQAQAEQPTITATPSGEKINFAAAGLPLADAVLNIASHLSRAETLTEWLDPSVLDETNPDKRDPDLDIYAASPIHRPPFSAEFIERFRAAQVARNRRITASVEDLLQRLAARNDGENERGFVVHRTMCDPRWIDLTQDPNERRPNWCYLGDPRVVNAGPVGLARYTTLRAWLSQWSYDRSRAKTAENAPSITVPSLVIENGADDATPASDPKTIFDLLGSSDKSFERIAGATHYYQQQPQHLQQALNICVDWLEKRGFTRGRGSR